MVQNQSLLDILKCVSEITVDEENSKRNSGCIQNLKRERKGNDGKERERKGRDGMGRKILRRNIRGFPVECQNVPKLAPKGKMT